MKTLLTRSLSGIVFVLIMATAILWNSYSYMLLMLVLLTGTLLEYFQIIETKRDSSTGKANYKWLVIAGSILLFLMSYVLTSPPVRSMPGKGGLLQILLDVLLMQRETTLTFTALLPCFLFVLFAAELFTKAKDPFGNLGWKVLAIIWITVPMLLTNNIYFSKGGYFLLIVFGLIWLYDSACYGFGTLFGKRPLFKRVSPKKTIEGMVGGVLFMLVVSWYLAPLLTRLQVSALTTTANSLSQVYWVVLALIIVVTATFGDLVESLLKRSLDVKDSGSIMPGHGGFLDRFDAYFLTVPFVYLALWLFNQIDNLMLMIEYISK